ncbi:MAG: hypothetical protein J5483_00015 [Lachnospiraceae bacterium]|nr:hypothetical protein [Lachnospiraceae bacterium]
MKEKKLRKTIGTKVLVGLLLVVMLVLSACGSGSKTWKMPDDIETVAGETAEQLVKNNPDPMISAVGGEWLVIAVYLSGHDAPESFYNHYYDNVRAEVKSKKGVITEDHYSDYDRLILCLHFLEKDFTNVEGYDLTPYLDDYEKISEQGSTVADFALIASNIGGFQLENEEAYIDLILSETGEATVMGAAGMTDYTAMALEALSFYRGRPDVDAFIEEGLKMLSAKQQEDGGMNNCEATAECIMMLVQLGLDPFSDERFIKDGKTLADGLMLWYLGKGQFMHDSRVPEYDALATEKALLALDALMLSKAGRKLYE